jgi:hypothetical protein
MLASARPDSKYGAFSGLAEALRVVTAVIWPLPAMSEG